MERLSLVRKFHVLSPNLLSEFFLSLSLSLALSLFLNVCWELLVTEDKKKIWFVEKDNFKFFFFRKTNRDKNEIAKM